MTTPSRLLLTLLISLLSMPVVAQRQYSPNLAVGVKGGMTMSRMSFSPNVQQKFLNGMLAGFTVRYTEENHYGPIGELNIQQRGWQEDFEGEPFTYSRTLTYVQIPMLTHIYFGSDKFRGFFNLGPEFAFMIGNSMSANFDYHNIATVPGFPTRNRVTEQMTMDISNKFDYGISAGLGIEFIARKKHSFMLEGRFYYGLGNIFPAAKKDYFSASRGMSIEVSAGYMFRIR